MNEDLVTELIRLERRIAADEYKIALTRANGGNDANKATLEEDLNRRIAETVNRMDSLRRLVTEPAAPPATSLPDRRPNSLEPLPVESVTPND